MRSTLALPLLLVFSVPAWADPPGQIVQPEDGQFSVRFPGRPKESKQKTKTELGNLTVFTATYAFEDGGVLAASYTTFPDDAVKAAGRKALLDGAVKGLLGKNGKLLGEKNIDIGTEKGREVSIGRGKQRLRYRLTVKDNRLIQVGVVGSRDLVEGKEATSFLESLHFKE
ncbi:MAG TPA: hypothetical protein VGI99_11635 [Gemmataceae bacterium]|jgi:hypothetical protein